MQFRNITLTLIAAVIVASPLIAGAQQPKSFQDPDRELLEFAGNEKSSSTKSNIDWDQYKNSPSNFRNRLDAPDYSELRNSKPKLSNEEFDRLWDDVSEREKLKQELEAARRRKVLIDTTSTFLTYWSVVSVWLLSLYGLWRWANKSRRRLVQTGVVLFVLMGLFPHWSFKGNNYGYKPLLQPPEERCYIDYNRLYLQWFMLLVMTGIGLVARPESNE